MPVAATPNVRIRLPGGPDYDDVRQTVQTHGLHTVCQSARCPNIGECWGERTATFMLLGNVCTRSCRFCAVQHGRPGAIDEAEPGRVADAIAKLDIAYAVITSVNRDDAPDGGAHIFAETIRLARERCPQLLIEVLIPDFCGDADSLQIVLDARPDVLNHNVETVPRLYRSIQPWSNWDDSLQVLSRAHKQGFVVKSGIIAGLGESNDEMLDAIRAMRETGCDILTVGQYMRPSKRHADVDRVVTNEEFKAYEDYGKQLGFAAVMSGPLVRSSYRAKWAYEQALNARAHA